MFDLLGATKRYGAVELFADLDFTVEQGEVVSILGPSGCGKTTLLRTVCGLESLDNGARHLNGTHLYPHLSVAQNIGLGAPRSVKKQEKQAAVSEVLETLGMPGFGNRGVAQLSGGEAQRVAFGRALLQSPDLILLDEPFASVDVKRRLELAAMTRTHLKGRNIAALHVTHDVEEAELLSDRMIHWSDLVTTHQEGDSDDEQRLARD